MDFETTEPDDVAAAIEEEIGREVDYRPVETDGARRAAAEPGGAARVRPRATTVPSRFTPSGQRALRPTKELQR